MCYTKKESNGKRWRLRWLRPARLPTGIGPEQFAWTPAPAGRFDAPEAVFTFSDAGYGGVSVHMHAFVREHIVRGEWKRKERPVLLNSWEASCFNFTEASLLRLAKAGRDAGIELFVMDDGWFGQLYRTGGRLTGAACAAALPDGGNLAEWCVVSPDKTKAVAVVVQETVRPHTSQITLRLCGLEDSALYRFTN